MIGSSWWEIDIVIHSETERGEEEPIWGMKEVWQGVLPQNPGQSIPGNFNSTRDELQILVF